MSLAKTANIKQLITFQKVARLGNVSMAAEELFLSQSATSIQLSNLEEAVGAKLLSRTGRGIRLTEAGEVLYTLSERVLNTWQEVSDEMESYLGDFSGTLRIGAVTTAEYWLPHAGQRPSIFWNRWNDLPGHVALMKRRSHANHMRPLNIVLLALEQHDAKSPSFAEIHAIAVKVGLSRLSDRKSLWVHLLMLR